MREAERAMLEMQVGSGPMARVGVVVGDGMVECMASIPGSSPVRGWHAAALGVECLPGRIAGLVAMVVHAGVGQPECIDSMRYRRRERCQEDGKASHPGSEGTTI